jgi:hypothetical protein
MKGRVRGKTLDSVWNKKMHKLYLKHRSRNAVTKDDASDDESSNEDEDDNMIGGWLHRFWL